jgi:hypothetical protein
VTGRLPCLLLPCLVLLLGAIATPVAAQAPHPSETPDQTIQRIHRALQAQPTLQLTLPATFYVDVLARKPTILDWLKDTNLKVGPMGALPPSDVHGAGGGFNVLPLIMTGIQHLRTAVRNYQVGKINERIDRELAALDGEN